MANDKKYELTPEQRTALKPALDKLESGFQELEKGLAALGRNPDDIDPGGGFCMRCTCSSFLGNGAKCERTFCRHARRFHWT